MEHCFTPKSPVSLFTPPLSAPHFCLINHPGGFNLDLRSPGNFQEEMKLYFDLEHQQNSERWKRGGSQGPGADENKGLLKAQKLNKKKK